MKHFDLYQKWVYQPNGRIYEIMWITPDVKGLPATDRIIFLVPVSGERLFMSLPLSLAGRFLSPPPADDTPDDGPQKGPDVGAPTV